MRAGLAKQEPARLAHWRKIDLYGQIRTARAGAKKFILHDGPPYANGEIHMGHALNKIWKDIIVKAKTLSGFDAPYVPGWDAHGLPIELVVEKKLKSSEKADTEVFLAACRDYANEQIAHQAESFIRLGVLGDWKHPYLTLAPEYEANIVRALSRIVKTGHLKKGFKPVHWCLSCRSALAEAEVEYGDKESKAIDVAFPLADPRWQAAFPDLPADAAVAIWTTTPWTLPANEAVALHPDLEYVWLQGPKKVILVAAPLWTQVTARLGWSEAKIIGKVRGHSLHQWYVSHPWQERTVPIIFGEHVTTDAGTGLVHTAPAHGPDDFQLGQSYHLPLYQPIDDRGCYTDAVSELAGVHIHKAEASILGWLMEKEVLLHQEPLNHSYPLCWRHKTPLIYRATAQWFIGVSALQSSLMHALEHVNFYPKSGETRLRSMLEGRPDWCISRQRRWGVPLCLLRHRQTGELPSNMVEIMQRVADAIEQEGLSAWAQFSVQDLMGEQGADYEKVQGTLDVWFDSGVSHMAVLEQRDELEEVADLYLEGSDQHRGWFQSSLISAMAMGKSQAPYKGVLTHGYTVDAQGYKMSKSKGNTIPPSQIFEKDGADVLRWMAASANYQDEQTVSDEVFARARDAYRRIRNTMRYLLANLSDFDPEVHLLAPSQWVALDAYILEQAREVQRQIQVDYDAYQMHRVAKSILHFCTETLGAFYLDVTKDRQYTLPANARARRSLQTAQYYLAHALVRWCAPILSFTSDEMWSYLVGVQESSVHLSTWADWPHMEVPLSEYWSEYLALRGHIQPLLEDYRRRGLIGSSLAAGAVFYVDGYWKDMLSPLGVELSWLLMLSEATFSIEPPPAEAVELLPGLFVVLYPMQADKCVRCWHYQESVGADPDDPQLCARCVVHIREAEGVPRQYV